MFHRPNSRIWMITHSIIWQRPWNSEIYSSFNNLRKVTTHDKVFSSQWSKTEPFTIRNEPGILESRGKLSSINWKRNSGTKFDNMPLMVFSLKVVIINSMIPVFLIHMKSTRKDAHAELICSQFLLHISYRHLLVII